MSCVSVLKTTFDLTTYHLNLSPMFLNCLLLDLTVIYLMSIVHMVKIRVEIAKKLKCGRPGGGGGVFSDCGHPRTRGGGGGQKRANFCGRPLWIAPYWLSLRYAIHHTYAIRGEFPAAHTRAFYWYDREFSTGLLLA